MNCQACRREIRDGSRFCPECGAPLGDSAVATFAAAPRPPRPPSTDPIDQARFIPGTMLAGRYRLVNLLGRGGMGEVYRAEDLKLGQPVALKFLPEDVAKDAERLSRFHQEVRVARQVSHPNVCRVYDISEADGQHFLSMEYVDGEDLASLLRRIGRLPADKAIQVARQLCAGLAAAHDRGVLHRDLKPANVLLDGRGRVRIADFGLAALADDRRDAGIVAGTPGYMAPEQLAGHDATTRTDVYALGLILYEIFTGKPALGPAGIGIMARAGHTSRPTSPSDVVADLDPAVERTIMRCLERDPAQRPVSAVAVAAALPGTDPLAAALAAGETPSPEMVAAAGGSEGMRPVLALACLIATTVGLLTAAWASDRAFIVDRVSLDLPPDVLANKAHEIITQFGYTDAPAGSAYGFAYNDAYLEYMRQDRESSARWSRLAQRRPPPIYFWYRESPLPLRVEFEEQVGGGRIAPLPGPPRLALVSATNPSPYVPGMRYVYLDSQGGLVELGVVPAQSDPTPRRPDGPDWNAVLTAAGLNTRQLQASDSTWTPPVAFDQRMAWTGSYAEQPDLALRVEVAAYQGRPVAFSVVGPRGPWDFRNPTESTSASAVPVSSGTGPTTPPPGFTVLAALAAFLAWANVRAGRGDRRGAFRIVLVSLALRMIGWTLSANHASGLGEFVLYRMALSESLVLVMTAYLFYLALEPYVRRRWPQTLISWSRALAGRLNDPLVGRDVLVGVTFAVLWFVIVVAMLWASGTPSASKELNAILSVRRVSGLFLMEADGAIESAVVYCFFMFLLRVVLRRDWAAAVAWAVLTGVVPSLFTHPTGLIATGGPGAIIGAAVGALMVIALIRFGLTAVATFFFVCRLVTLFPTTLNPSSWYVGVSIFTLGTILALAAYACYRAMGDQPWLSFLSPEINR